MDKRSFTEQGIKKFLIEKFDQLLRASEDEQITIANEINDYADEIVRKENKIKLSKDLWEIIYGCLDLHDWGEIGEFKPTYKITDIRKILYQLKEAFSLK